MRARIPVAPQTMEGMRVLADMRAAGFKPRENTCIFLLKEASARGAFEEAFATVRDMADTGVTPRLRSYAPLLTGLLEQVISPSSPPIPSGLAPTSGSKPRP